MMTERILRRNWESKSQVKRSRWVVRQRMREGPGHKGVKGKALWELQVVQLP